MYFFLSQDCNLPTKICTCSECKNTKLNNTFPNWRIKKNIFACKKCKLKFSSLDSFISSCKMFTWLKQLQNANDVINQRLFGITFYCVFLLRKLRDFWSKLFFFLIPTPPNARIHTFPGHYFL